MMHRLTMRDGRITASITLGIVLVSTAGCRHNFANENDRLRTEVLDLQSQNQQLRSRNAELQAAVQSAASAPTTLPDDIRLNTPMAVDLSIEKLSFVKDTDGDGRADRLFLYVQPTDGLGRFTQVVGSMDVTAAEVPMHGEPRTLAQVTFSPGQVRDAYRSGITGVHYTFEAPLTAAGSSSGRDEVGSCLVRVQFRDGLTGRTLAAERTLPLK